MDEKTREIRAGDVFEDLDKRAGDRVVKVIYAPEADLDAYGSTNGKVKVETTVNTFKPKSVGRSYWIKRSTLGDAERYQRISH